MKENDKFSYDENERVKCIDGCRRHYKYCIGFCNNICHKGFITKRALEEHKCIEKKCTFLDPIKTHNYWISMKQKIIHKEEIKEIRKKRKNDERAILANVKELVQDDVELVMCKHLYYSTYLLIIMKPGYINEEVLQDISNKLNVCIYVKSIYERQRQNIQYIYDSLLPENMREQLRKYKNDQKRKRT